MKNLILLTLIVLFTISCNDDTQTAYLSDQIDSLKLEHDALRKILNEKELQNNYWFDEEYDGGKFIKMGIANPAKYIEDKLRERIELIPLEAVLGGTMYFVNVQLLSSQWLIADYEDGHIEGRGIYQYKINEDGEVEFELLAAMRPD